MSADLVPFLAAGDTPADKVAVLARVAGLKDVIAEREQAVRSDLEASVRTLAEAAGGQFTLRCDAGTAVLQGGNAKPTFRDREALASWLADEEPHLVTFVERVEVLDHGILAESLGRLASAQKHDDPAAAAAEAWNLAGYLKVVREPLMPEDVLDQLVANGYAIAGEVVVHVESGQPLPGVTVTTTREQLRVTPNKDVRGRVAADLRGQLGALTTGSDA